jgi:hypothetical protein
VQNQAHVSVEKVLLIGRFFNTWTTEVSWIAKQIQELIFGQWSLFQHMD